MSAAHRLVFTLCVAALVGCGADSAHHVTLSTLAYDVPVDWSEQETKLTGEVTAIWTPEDNARKESVTVVRTERSPATAQAGLGKLAELVVASQVPGAKVSTPRPIVTASGLRGVRVEVAYVPPGMTREYQRIHIVLVDGSTLVHVMYTALTADPALDALNVVLGSIRHEEA